jgi:hypothetical protein
VDLSLVRREGKVDLWLELEDVKKGQVHLRLSWFAFSNNPADLKTALSETLDSGLSAAMLTVRVDSASNLPVSEIARKKFNKPTYN